MISYLKQFSVLLCPLWQCVLTGLLDHPLWQTCSERGRLMSRGKLRLLERLFLLRVLNINAFYVLMTHSAVYEADSGRVGWLRRDNLCSWRYCSWVRAWFCHWHFCLTLGRPLGIQSTHHGGLVARLQLASLGAEFLYVVLSTDSVLHEARSTLTMLISTHYFFLKWALLRALLHGHSQTMFSSMWCRFQHNILLTSERTFSSLSVFLYTI